MSRVSDYFAQLSAPLGAIEPEDDTERPNFDHFEDNVGDGEAREPFDDSGIATPYPLTPLRYTPELTELTDESLALLQKKFSDQLNRSPRIYKLDRRESWAPLDLDTEGPSQRNNNVTDQNERGDAIHRNVPEQRHQSPRSTRSDGGMAKKKLAVEAGDGLARPVPGGAKKVGAAARSAATDPIASSTTNDVRAKVKKTPVVDMPVGSSPSAPPVSVFNELSTSPKSQPTRMSFGGAAAAMADAALEEDQQSAAKQVDPVTTTAQMGHRSGHGGRSVRRHHHRHQLPTKKQQLSSEQPNVPHSNLHSLHQQNTIAQDQGPMYWNGDGTLLDSTLAGDRVRAGLGSRQPQPGLGNDGGAVPTVWSSSSRFKDALAMPPLFGVAGSDSGELSTVAESHQWTGHPVQPVPVSPLFVRRLDNNTMNLHSVVEPVPVDFSGVLWAAFESPTSFTVMFGPTQTPGVYFRYYMLKPIPPHDPALSPLIVKLLAVAAPSQ